ncbi:MAG: MarR family transcriptional regulator [Inhella sp.]
MPRQPGESEVFLRFLSLVEAIRGLPTFPALDAVEERVFHALAAAWGQGRSVTVMDAMRLLPEISPSTAHRRLKELRAKGLIQMREDGGDGRLRLVRPTQAARAYFSKLGRCIGTAASGE